MHREATLTQTELLAALPDSLAELAEHISTDCVLELAARYGGTRIYVPHVVRESSELAQVVGFQSARKLSAMFGGDLLPVPRAAQVERAIRNKGICEGRIKGQSITFLARRFELTRRQVMNILKGECLRKGRKNGQ